jgi:hypothetical protein
MSTKKSDGFLADQEELFPTETIGASYYNRMDLIAIIYECIIIGN